MTHVAKLGIGLVERQHDQALEELVQFESVVASLGRLALDDAPVRRRDLKSVVHLVGAL